jgi:hypothetical protein
VIAAWLFLYVGGLVHVMATYGLDFDNPRTAVLLVPFALVPLPLLLQRRRPDLFAAVPPRAMAVAGLLCALAFLRGINLDFWASHSLPSALVIAAMGLTSFWVAIARPYLEDGPAIWLRIGVWQLTGFLNPGLPLAGASVFAVLGTFGFLRPVAYQPSPARAPQAFTAALLLGLVLAKPWWDYSGNGGWAPDLAAWGLGAALAYPGFVRSAGARVPMALLQAALAVLFVVYSPELGWAWGLLLGLIWGWIWQRLARPLPRQRLTYGFLLGLVLSFALHANLQLPGLRHLLWLGN